MPYIEFAYNRHVHSATHMSPFEVVYGFNPLTPTDLLPLPRNEHLNVNGRDRANRIKELHKDARDNLIKTTEMYARQGNKGRKELVLQPGDWVWVHMRKERFPAKRRNKLSNRGDGPFKVLERINNNAYRLELPSEYGIHATFNVADLSLYDRAEDTTEEYPDADRLMSQPSQGGGDDTDLDQRTMSLVRFPEGPSSRHRLRKFTDKVQELIKEWEYQPAKFQALSNSTSRFSNFKHLIKYNGNIKYFIELKEDPSGSDI